MSTPTQGRVTLLDALKGLASHLIVFHHLAFYGQGDAAWSFWPGLWRWLASDARYAVQVFLVIGGFLAARGLAPQGRLRDMAVLPTLWNRYVRLTVPFLVMLVMAILAAAVARDGLGDESVSAAPTWPQVLAHVGLMHDILGYEALSAGVWYVAIDLQLFAMLLGLLWAAREVGSRVGQGTRSDVVWSMVAVACLALASLFHFNRDPSWDIWGLYFFGAYGLGVFAWWGSNRASSWFGLIAMTAAGALALAVAWRERLVLALVIALVLGLARRLKWRADLRNDLPGAGGQLLGSLGQYSYSLFLVHYPVFLVINALFARFDPGQSGLPVVGVLLTWGCSVVVAWGFHHLVEKRATRLTWPINRRAHPLGA